MGEYGFRKYQLIAIIRRKLSEIGPRVQEKSKYV